MCWGARGIASGTYRFVSPLTVVQTLHLALMRAWVMVQLGDEYWIDRTQLLGTAQCVRWERPFTGPHHTEVSDSRALCAG